jgi:flagellar assembly protein FliH
MAGILKLGQKSLAVPQPAPTYQFDDMGQSYLDRVRAEAAKIVAEARIEAAKIKVQAAEEGKQAALQAVEASLKKRIDGQLQSLVAALEQAVAEIAGSRQAWQSRWERHAVELATAIAGRIVRRRLQAEPEITLDLVRESLQLAAGSGRIVVRLHPQDHAALAEQATRLVQRMSLVARAEIVADPAIVPGGCRVDTEFGSIDQQIETQLARITEELLE